MAELRRRGRRISRHPPFGFMVIGNGLVPVEEEQRILRRMLELREVGAGPTAIARALETEDLRNPGECARVAENGGEA